MQEFHYVLKHRVGVENKPTDTLSHQVSILHTMSTRVVGFERLAYDYPECPDFGDIYAALSRDPPDLREGYTISDGYLLMGPHLCVPQLSLRDFLIWELHAGGAAGHFGRDKTIALVEDHFFLARSEEGRYYCCKALSSLPDRDGIPPGLYTSLPVP